MIGSLAECDRLASVESRLRRALTATLAAFVAFGSACAIGSNDPNAKFLEYGDPSQPRHFMVLPLNLAIKTAPEFEPLLDDVFGAIAGYIRDNGSTLETISRRDATAGWAKSIVEVKASTELKNNFLSAMRVYAINLAKTHSFDSVIVPSLVYRVTKPRDRTVKWDGVFRKVKIINLSDEARKKRLAKSLALDVSGVSLHVMVFAPNGELIFQKYGGLDVIHDVDMENVEFTLSPRLSLKEKPLRESDHLDEGLGVAFDPYIPRR